MTSGVPFHYVGNVKAQLSQWLYPWCKGNSVISFFLSLSFSFFEIPSPLLLLSFSSSRAAEIFIGTANRVPFVSEVHAARPLVTSRFGGGRWWLETFHLTGVEIEILRNMGREWKDIIDIFERGLSSSVEGIVVYFSARNFLFKDIY